MNPVAVLEAVVRVRGVQDANREIARVEQGLSGAERAAVDATREVEQFGRMSATANVDADTRAAVSKVHDLKDEIDGLRDKTVHIRTVTTGDADGGGGGKDVESMIQRAGILQRTIALVKPAAMIAGLGMATQAMAAAAAGAIALGSALAPLAGAYAAYPSLLAAFAQGMGVARLGMLGLGKAGEGISKALEKPLPAVKNFKAQLDGFIPQLVHLRNLAQGPILRGLSAGVDAASANLSRLNPIVRQTANVLGGLAKEAGELVGSSAWGRDISVLGNRNAKIIDLLGHAALNVADALRHVVMAAGPLTMWLARLANGWSQNLKAAAEAGRESGRLASFFEQTRAVMTRLFSIAGNLGTAFWNIAKAGNSLGNELLAALDKTTASFAAWTKSTEGQNKIRAFFQNARGPIFEVAKLIRDAGKAFLSLSQQPGLEKMIHQLRTQLLPVLIRVMNSTTAAFGPAFVDMVIAVANAFEPLAGSSGPLVLYVHVLTDLAKVAAWIMRNVPGAATAVSLLAGAFAVSKAIGFAGSITGLTKAFTLLRSSAIAATAAQWLLNTALFANPIGIVVLAVAGLVAAFVLLGGKLSWLTDAFGAAWGFIKDATGVAWGAIKAVVGAVIGWIVQNVTGSLGTLRTVIAGAWSAISAVTGAVWGTIRGVISGAWGAISGVVSGAVNGVRGAVTGAWGAISSATSSAWNAIKGVVSGAAGAISDAVHSTIGGLRDWISGVWSSIRERATDAWDSIKGAISGAVRSALSAVKGLVSDFAGIGGDIVRGIARGIRDAASSVIDAIGDVVKSAVRHAKQFLGIGSPSKVFAQLGGWVGEGFANGIVAQISATQDAMARLVAPPPIAAPAAGGAGRAAVASMASSGMGGGVTVMGDLVVNDRSDADRVAARLAWLGAHG